MHRPARSPCEGAPFQSLLFVPGSRPERFAKALASRADMICIDLEDAVPHDEKDAARAAVLATLEEGASERIAVRINRPSCRAGLADLVALIDSPARPAMLLLPKVESPEEVELVAAALADAPLGLVPLIESARGLRRAHEIAGARGIVAMMFGGGDLAAELGVELCWEPLLGARHLFLHACAEAGLPSIDVPFVHLSDSVGLEQETRLCKRLGFAAKAAIHPAQIDTIHRVMRPTAEEIAEATEAEAAFAAAGGAAIRFRGKLLEAPIMRRYRQILVLKDIAHA